MDGTKQPIPFHHLFALDDFSVDPIRVDVCFLAERPGADPSSESSSEVYCGSPQQLAVGFALALRVMGLEADIPEGDGECLPSFSEKDD